ncbi:L-lysine 2,3-aminomutase [Planctomycetes bacterium Pan216]|uniref:L-lysine 2,3-aminomutase n=1 Tax=Kolteria novifilia TaxID=2527975 RepID=A0A518BCG7_9BACT|nr:L-lysine 2,3-aminomutase [Planctomycetes bacterium Pan216]
MHNIASPQTNPRPTWRKALAQAIRDPDELCDLLDLPKEIRTSARAASKLFPLVVPREFVERMRPGDPNDPLLRQVLPLDAEAEEVPGFTVDPVGDAPSRRADGLLHKYHGRALLITTGVCAVHCRYCFRRHYPYHEEPRGLEAWEPALACLADDPLIAEVILSGGDPLTLTDEWLARLASRFEEIGHLQRLRVHTRLPIVLPQRVDDALLAWLTGTHLQPIMVVHANHPSELDDACRQALRRLVDAGVLVLNQAVLLKGINDDAATLARLCLELVSLRVMPYYLHQVDRVSGAAHFEVSEERGLQLMEDLRGQLPGYALPKYVREVSGEASKMPVELVSLSSVSQNFA